MRGISVLDKTAELERRVTELEQYVRGIQQSTQGWNGEVLTVRDLIILGGTWVDVPLEFVPGWIPYGAPYNTLRYKVVFGKFVMITGTLKSGVNADGTVIATVPADGRPLINQPIAALSIQGGSGTNDPQAIVDPGGGITIFGIASNSYLHLFGFYSLD
jgi:hypothetical protein